MKNQGFDAEGKYNHDRLFQYRSISGEQPKRSEEDVQLLIEDGKRFVAITVSPAKQSEMPVYIEGNIMTGSYYRSGDSDYRLSEEKVWEIPSDAKRLRNR